MIKNVFIGLVLLIGFINGDETNGNLSTENYTSVIVANKSGVIVENNLNQKINIGKKEQHADGDVQIKLDLSPEDHSSKNQSIKAPPDTQPSADGYQFMYLITPVSLAILGVILWRTMRLKKTRAEIKYGNAEKTELKPLPLTLDGDSTDDENEETNQTLFDINQLKNSRENFA